MCVCVWRGGRIQGREGGCEVLLLLKKKNLLESKGKQREEVGEKNKGARGRGKGGRVGKQSPCETGGTGGGKGGLAGGGGG